MRSAGGRHQAETVRGHARAAGRAGRRPGSARRWRAGALAGLAAVVGCGGTADGLVEVNGTRLFVYREGRGEPAIVIHGGPVLDHSYLVPWLAPLGDDVELVYYDQRLSGRSDGVVDSASVRLATFVEDIEALREALGFERVHLIAHSWGGLLALSYAVAHQNRVLSMVLLSPMPPSAELWAAEQDALARTLSPQDTAGMGVLRAASGFAEREPPAVEAMLRHGFRSQFHDPALAERLDFHLEPDYGERSRQFGFMLPDLVAFDLQPDLRRVSVPTLMVYGAEEPGAAIGGDALLADLSRAYRVVIPRAGHFPFIEQPRTFLATVRTFLPR